MFASYLAEYRVVPGRLGCSWVVFINQSLAIWEWISKCGQYHQGHDHQDRQSGQDSQGEWARVNASQRPASAASAVADFRFISRIRPSSIDKTQCNEPRQQLFHNAFNDVPLIDTLFGNELRQSILLLFGCPKALT